MLIGSKYYVTFDNKYYDFEGKCTYLLANDFDDHNFTLLVSYDEHISSNEIIIVLEKTVVRVNLDRNVSSLYLICRFLLGNSFILPFYTFCRKLHLMTLQWSIYQYKLETYISIEISDFS